MISVSIKQAKIIFREQAVLTPVEKAKIRYVSQVGAFIRRDARSSMRRRKTPSPPGKPPRVVDGLLKKFLFFIVDRQDPVAVTIGPSSFGEGFDAPRALEFGGVVTRNVYARRRLRSMQVRLEARPYMQPAYDKTAGKLPDLFSKAFNK